MLSIDTVLQWPLVISRLLNEKRHRRSVRRSVSGAGSAQSLIEMFNSHEGNIALQTRAVLVRRGRRLEYLTIAWNTIEAFASLLAATLAGSIALFAFGLDSLIEVASATALLWRLNRDAIPAARDRADRISLRIVGTFFIVLSVYIVGDSLSALVFRHVPDRSVLGIVVSCASLVVMPLLARSKRIVATGMASAALHADAKQTDICAYLSAILLGGLMLNALFGWWWADPLASISMAPIIAREGYRSFRGERCCSDSCD